MELFKSLPDALADVVLRVAETSDVGVARHVRAPEAFVVLLVARQKKIEDEDPLAVTDPFKVAAEVVTLVAAEVVTLGALAGTKDRTFPYEVPALFVA